MSSTGRLKFLVRAWQKQVAGKPFGMGKGAQMVSRLWEPGYFPQSARQESWAAYSLRLLMMIRLNRLAP